MSWNYRVIRKTNPHTETYFYHIHEVYYDDNKKIKSWSTKPMSPYGETPEEIKKDLTWMLLSCDKPILEEVVDNYIETLVEIKE